MASDGFKPTEAMAKAAKRGLELRRKNGGKGGTAVGVARARDIANRKNLSLSTVKRMHSFFSRHSGNEKPSGGAKRSEDKGYISFLLWGGSPGKSWAKSIVNRNNKKELSMSKLNTVERSEYVSGDGGTVDMDKGVLLGVKVIQMGRVNDARPFFVDETTLGQIVELGNQPAKGLKVRYTHAGREDAMGSHLGRASNFRIEGDCVRADVVLAKSSFISPKGNLGGYVLTLAEEDSLSLGMSVAGTLDAEEMSTLEEGGVMPLRFLDLYSADVVADPAATRNGLFSTQEPKGMAEEKNEEMREEEAPLQASEQPQEELSVEGDKVVTEEVKASEESSEELSEDKEEKLEEHEEEELEEHKEEEMNDHYPEGKMDEHEEKKEEELSEEPSEEPAVELSAAHEEFVTEFGSEGAVWFLEGKTMGECFKIKAGRLAEEVEGLKAQIAEFESLKAAGEFALGEEAPVVPSVEMTEEQKAEAAKAEEFAALRAKGISESEIAWSRAFQAR